MNRAPNTIAPRAPSPPPLLVPKVLAQRIQVVLIRQGHKEGIAHDDSLQLHIQPLEWNVVLLAEASVNADQNLFACLRHA